MRKTIRRAVTTEADRIADLRGVDRGDSTIYSAAVEAVIAAEHPSPESGGPCHGCAFRSGTVANRDDVTQAMIRLCVEGYRTFDCHMQSGLCKGYIAAANVRGVATTKKERLKSEVYGMAADHIAGMIDNAKRLRG